MIWLVLALALHPPMIETAGIAGQRVDLDLLLVGDERVRLTTTPPLILEEDITVTKSMRHLTSARIHPSTPPGNHTAYLYATPRREDAVLVGVAIPVRVAVHDAPHNTRIIPNHSSGWWAALAGTITALTGLAFAIKIRRTKTAEHS